jgi:hypothetical protein
LGATGDSTCKYPRFCRQSRVFWPLMAWGAAEKGHGAYPNRCFTKRGSESAP